MVDKYTINVGDRVAYRAAYMRSIGSYSYDLASRRGVVKSVVIPLHNGHAVVAVHWDDGFGANINTANLIRADKLHLEPV